MIVKLFEPERCTALQALHGRASDGRIGSRVSRLAASDGYSGVTSKQLD